MLSYCCSLLCSSFSSLPAEHPGSSAWRGLGQTYVSTCAPSRSHIEMPVDPVTYSLQLVSLGRPIARIRMASHGDRVQDPMLGAAWALYQMGVLSMVGNICSHCCNITTGICSTCQLQPTSNGMPIKMGVGHCQQCLKAGIMRCRICSGESTINCGHKETMVPRHN